MKIIPKETFISVEYYIYVLLIIFKKKFYLTGLNPLLD